MSGELVHGVGSRCSRAAKARISRTATRSAVLPPVAPSLSEVSAHSTLSAPTAPSACTVLDPPPGSRTLWTHGGGSNKRLFFRGGPTGPTGPTPSRTRPHAREALSALFAAPKFLPASPARRVQRVQRVQSLFLDSRWTHPVGPEGGGVGPDAGWAVTGRTARVARDTQPRQTGALTLLPSTIPLRNGRGAGGGAAPTARAPQERPCALPTPNDPSRGVRGRYRATLCVWRGVWVGGRTAVDGRAAARDRRDPAHAGVLEAVRVHDPQEAPAVGARACGGVHLRRCAGRGPRVALRACAG